MDDLLIESNLASQLDIFKIVFAPSFSSRFETSKGVSYPFSLNQIMHSLVRSLALTQDLQDCASVDATGVFTKLSASLKGYADVQLDEHFKTKFAIDSITNLDFAYSELVEDEDDQKELKGIIDRCL